MRAILGLALSMLAVLPGESGRDVAVPDPLPEPLAVESGARLYTIYCAGCHGLAGRGDGPAAAALARRPADLGVISRSNGGVFPTARVILSVDGRTPVPGQPGRRMPIFGLSLQDPDSDANQEREVREKILDLVAYLRSVQSGVKS